MLTEAPQTIVLRGQPLLLAARPSQRSPVSMTSPRREDGSLKGPGYFGEVYNSKDPDLFCTEASYHLELRIPHRRHGRLRHAIERRLCPLLVPGLSRDEMAHLVAGGDPTPGILATARHWAEQRIAGGQSPFAGWDKPVYPLPAGGP